MKQYYITTLILVLIVAVGAIYIVPQKGDVRFKDYDYNPEDWVTTNNTLLTTDLSNR